MLLYYIVLEANLCDVYGVRARERLGDASKRWRGDSVRFSPLTRRVPTSNVYFHCAHIF